MTRLNREKVTITDCDIPTTTEAFRTGLERDSPLYDELTKYPCRTIYDVQTKTTTQVRLEEDRRINDDKYDRPNEKITTLRISDYKPHNMTSSIVEGVSKHMGLMLYPKFPPF